MNGSNLKTPPTTQQEAFASSGIALGSSPAPSNEVTLSTLCDQTISVEGQAAELARFAEAVRARLFGHTDAQAEVASDRAVCSGVIERIRDNTNGTSRHLEDAMNELQQIMQKIS